jgi:hypothetical protein
MAKDFTCSERTFFFVSPDLMDPGMRDKGGKYPSL